MTLPKEVLNRLAARAVTDIDVGMLLEMVTKGDDTVREPSPEGVGDVEAPKL